MSSTCSGDSSGTPSWRDAVSRYGVEKLTLKQSSCERWDTPSAHLGVVIAGKRAMTPSEDWRR